MPGVRRLPIKTVAAALKGKATGTVRIACDASVPDSYDPLGMEILTALEVAGWTVLSLESTPVSPVKRNTKEYEQGRSVAPRFRQGVTIEGILGDCEGKDTPYCSLFNAFKVSGLEFQAARDAKLPEGTFRIMIGPRPLLPAKPAK